MDTEELQRIKNRYDIIGNDAVLNRAIETAVAVAHTDLAVLVTGESGVGKENIPSIIHQNSPRRNGKFFSLNCGSIPEGTINSELFGHVKGAFTGALGDHKGYFEEANGGTIFLDEIGEMPMTTQVMLLRVLQNGEFMKVGSSKVEKTDVRVIAATNVNLLYAVSQGKFRADLYYRLCGINIQMPSLRERKDDIYLLFRKFAADFSDRYRVCRITLTRDAISMLTSYRWPGNIRQLKNITEALCALESVKVAPGVRSYEVDAIALSRYIPKETGETLPAVVAAQGAPQMDEDTRQMLFNAISMLGRKVEALEKEVSTLKAAAGHGATLGIAAPEHMQAPEVQEPEFQEAEIQPEVVEAPSRTAPATIEETMDELIARTLDECGGNRKEAARRLGKSERTLYRWIDKHPDYSNKDKRR